MTVQTHRFILTICMVLVLSCPVFADYIEPSSIRTEAQRYPVVKNPLNPQVYHYDVTWQGIPVGSAIVTVAPSDARARASLGGEYGVDTVFQEDIFSIKAEAKSAKVIDVFYKLRHESESFVRKSNLQPIQFRTWQKENSKTKKAQVSFKPDGLIDSFAEKDGRIERKHVFTSPDFILDPISAAFFARSIPIEVGGRAEFDVFNGKHRYLISFDVVSIEDIPIQGAMRKAFKTIPQVKKLTDTEGESRLREATLWISADDAREVLKLESKVFVGSVGATLVKTSESISTENQVLSKK